MSFKAPKGWTSETDALFIHTTGARIQRTTYRQKEGWFLIPTEIETPVVEFAPNAEGRDKAFAEFPRLAQEWKEAKKKLAAKKKGKEENEKTKAKAKVKAKVLDEDGEPRDDEEGEGEEKEEKEDEDEGAEG